MSFACNIVFWITWFDSSATSKVLKVFKVSRMIFIFGYASKACVVNVYEGNDRLSLIVSGGADPGDIGQYPNSDTGARRRSNRYRTIEQQRCGK